MSFDIFSHLRRQREFSERTFGPGKRVAGVCDHITKELIEVRDSDGALEEWVDVIILALDGAWRSGATPEQIIAAIVCKQMRNEARTWPDWRTVPAGQAIEHVRDKLPSAGVIRVGDMVRYSDGPTALLIVTDIKDHGKDRPRTYYGRHCMGGTGVGYEPDVRHASDADRITWEASAEWRQRFVGEAAS